MASSHATEIEQGTRFGFGENWSRFLSDLNEDRINLAEQSLRHMLGVPDLHGKSFLDVGSGSGLFSLAARRLGASVRSFDYDTQSVGCATELKRRYFPDAPDWVIEHGSVLDEGYLATLGQFEVVYSWGVLHHTGNMTQALDNLSPLVSQGGQLFIAVYNDQGRPSRRWLKIKRTYNRLPVGLKWIVLLPALAQIWGVTIVRDLLKGRPFHSWRNYSVGTLRGMSPWHDLVDWVGGLPFEVAKPEEIFGFYRDRGFKLVELVTCAGGLGCNEYVFCKKAKAELNSTHEKISEQCTADR